MYENPNCDLIIKHVQICHNHQTCEGHKNTMKNGCFTIGLATHHIDGAIHYNSIATFVETTHFQLVCNSITTTTITLC
jgi:hypothetical protein